MENKVEENGSVKGILVEPSMQRIPTLGPKVGT